MPMGSSSLARALAALSLALLAACGSPRLTKGQLIQQADAICKASQSKTDELTSQLPDSATAATLPMFADAFGKILPVLQDTSRRLHALKPPTDDAAAIQAWLDAFDATVDQVDELQKAAASGDLAAFNVALDQSTSLGTTADVDATAYGFTVCGGAA
jgi:hypothetical protein